MLIEIETHDRRLEFDMMESMSLKVGQQHSVPGGAVLTAQGHRGQKSFGMPETVTFLLEYVGGPIATGLVSNWLYAKMKGRAEKLRINRREVHIDKVEIKRSLDEITTTMYGIDLIDETTTRE